jgi:hypothetical protein
VYARAYAAMLVIGLAIVLLEDATDGRSWGLLAVAGLIAVADSVLYLRRSDVGSPKRTHEVARPLTAIAGIVVGTAFVILGALVALGLITPT